MAKRYKEKQKRKVKPVKIIITLIFLCAVVVSIIINFKKDVEVQQEKEEIINMQEIDKNMRSNLLIPKEINEELLKKIGQEYYIVKLQYKLQSLEKGKIEAYYSNAKNIVKVIINIENEKIEEIEYVTDEYLVKKNKIEDNLEENIKEDFNNNKSKIGKENELNIIITDTEIVININFT